jgi:hypothetical protein
MMLGRKFMKDQLIILVGLSLSLIPIKLALTQKHSNTNPVVMSLV